MAGEFVDCVRRQKKRFCSILSIRRICNRAMPQFMRTLCNEMLYSDVMETWPLWAFPSFPPALSHPLVLSWLPPASSLLVANTVLSVLSRFFSLALLSFHAGFMLLLQWKRCKWVRDLRFNTLRSDRLLILSPHLPVSSVFASLPLCVTLSDISFPSIFMLKKCSDQSPADNPALFTVSQ